MPEVIATRSVKCWATDRYTIERVAFTRLSDDDLAQWRALRRWHEASPYSDPDWMRGYFDEKQLENLWVFLLYEGGRLEGAAAFLRLAWPLHCHLGPFRVASFPLVRLRMIGEMPDFPAYEEAYSGLLESLAQLEGVHTVFLEGVPVDSLLWKYLHRSEISQWFRLYAPSVPTPRSFIRITGTFEGYLKGLSARHRHNLRRRVTKFKEETPDPVSWKRYSGLEEVDVFLDHALAVSRQSYQWKRFRRGLSDTERLRRRLQFAARNGWLRSYLLFAGQTPVAFVAGWQHHGCYEHHEIGYDPAWRRWAVGTVLHMHMIRDLFEHDPPRTLDFGAYAGYKEEFANETHIEGTVFLFRPRSPYVLAVQYCHATCNAVTAAVSAALNRWGVASVVRRLVKR